MSTITDLIVEQGRAAAQARAENGAIWGRAIQNISQAPAQIIAAKTQQDQQARLNTTADAENALRTQALGTAQKQAADTTLTGRILGSGLVKDDGTMDGDAMATLARNAGRPDLVPAIQAHVSAANLSNATLQEKQTAAQTATIALQAARRDQLGEDAQSLIDPKTKAVDPDLLKTFIASRVANGTIPKDQGEALAQRVHDDPTTAPAIVQQWVSGSKSVAAARKANMLTTPEGATVSDISTNPPTPIIAGKPKPPTGPELDAAAQALYAKKAAGTPLTTDEASTLAGYEARKRVVSDPAALAATTRQTNAIGAQTAQQGRAQSFEMLKTARADIQKNADTPYQTAHASANTLRDVVDAAKNGNDVAGSLQSLETTMAAIRAQGLNRVNQAEIGSTQNAGSLAENISAWISKQEKGKAAAVPPKVQQDMADFADILDKAAAKKYQDTHNGINKLYGTTIPPTFDVSSTLATPAKKGDTKPIDGFPGTEQTFDGTKWIRSK